MQTRGSSFQSTHPLRGATSKRARIALAARFQSTHPMRGATFKYLPQRGAGEISIHAPHAGCDSGYIEKTIFRVRFQSTHPMRGATIRHKTLSPPDLPFQSTHPMRGATLLNTSFFRWIWHFNPRTPCGVRRKESAVRWMGRSFQSTHPMRGATKKFLLSGMIGAFQSTHPMRGATLDDAKQSPHGRNFNPRTPCGVRL